MSGCPNCGASDDRLLPVWEDPQSDAGETQPKFLGCPSCHQLLRTAFQRDGDDETPPQAQLTDTEIARLPIGNQNDGTPLTLIEWQCVKGAAVRYGVRDWTAKVDPTLTKDENVTLMERLATYESQTTLRERKTRTL
jgi:hypothetical protein